MKLKCNLGSPELISPLSSKKLIGHQGVQSRHLSNGRLLPIPERPPGPETGVFLRREKWLLLRERERQRQRQRLYKNLFTSKYLKINKMNIAFIDILVSIFMVFLFPDLFS